MSASEPSTNGFPLGPAGAASRAAFAQLVEETLLELEKRVLRGEEVDGTLLQMLRVISVEAAEYGDDGDAVMRA